MVPKSGASLSKSRLSLSDAQFAELIGSALQHELGGSRRASKTIMTWAGVTDHTARAWLNGRKSPSSLHLVQLAAHSPSVMTVVLRLTGHERIGITIELESLEIGLESALAIIRELRSTGAASPH